MNKAAGAADLDGGQYSAAAIHKYEAIYGRNFISPGGEATTLSLLGLLSIAPGMRVLDIGCGLGGAAFLMARRFGAHVDGIDFSRNMLQSARERCAEAGLEQAVTFTHADVLHYQGTGSYDLVHSRDAFLHIHNKTRLFNIIAGCLRQGGRLLFTDYMRRPGAQDPEFVAYIHSRGYDLRTLEEYGTLLEQAGLDVLRAEDRTAEFAAILARELAALNTSALAQAERDELAQNWQAKQQHARAGDHRWGLFIAQKL